MASTVEGVWVEIPLKRKRILGCFYRHHVSNVVNGIEIVEGISTVVDKLCNSDVIICGDFNMPGIFWKTLSAENAYNQDGFLNDFLSLGLSQKVTFPTFHSSRKTLDLIFENSNLVDDVKEIESVSFSGHATVYFKAEITSVVARQISSSYDFRKMDTGLMRMYQQLQNWDIIFLELFVPVKPRGNGARKRLPKYIVRLGYKLTQAK